MFGGCRKQVCIDEYSLKGTGYTVDMATPSLSFIGAAARPVFSVISPFVVVPSEETTKGCPLSSCSLSSRFLRPSRSSSAICLSISASILSIPSASARSRSSAAFLSASALAAYSLRDFSPTMAFQAATSLCASATAFSFSLIDRNNSSGVSPFSFSAFAAFNFFSAPRKNTNAKGST